MGKFQSVSDHCIVSVLFITVLPTSPHSKWCYFLHVKSYRCLSSAGRSWTPTPLRLHQWAPTQDPRESLLCRLTQKELDCVGKALTKMQTLLPQRKIIRKVLEKRILFSPFPIRSSRTSPTQLLFAMLQTKQAGVNWGNSIWGWKCWFPPSEDLSHWLILLVLLGYNPKQDFSLYLSFPFKLKQFYEYV